LKNRLYQVFFPMGENKELQPLKGLKEFDLEAIDLPAKVKVTIPLKIMLTQPL